MRVLVLVEGISDAKSLSQVLRPVLNSADSRGIGVEFKAWGGKARLLNLGLRYAATYLAEHEEDWCIALPDLYPWRDFKSPWQHTHAGELRQRLQEGFNRAARARGGYSQMQDRFIPHVLQHDLEVLLLAAEEPLRRRLGINHLGRTWQTPVEDQNGGHPPKSVIQALFLRHKGTAYQDTVDAPWILKQAGLEALCGACPQSFAPFVDDLQRLIGR